MHSDAVLTPDLLLGMRAAFARGENVMAYARDALGVAANTPAATLIAYDLQAGSYVARVRSDPAGNDRWCAQLAGLLDPLVDRTSSVLEVGCGEATTLGGVIERLARPPCTALGLDLSWSRCASGLAWLRSRNQDATLFVGDLFSIPLANDSVDVVFSSHSLEPNGGREQEALREMLRVARRAVVLVEPIYELGSADAQSRMRLHGYVRNLKATAEDLGGIVNDYRLLPYSPNPLNPSGVVTVTKAGGGTTGGGIAWQCPFTGAPLQRDLDGFHSPASGLAYPTLRGIPLLRAEHAVMASRFEVTAPRVGAAA